MAFLDQCMKYADLVIAIVIAVCTLFYILAFALPDWVGGWGLHIGLWQMCQKGSCADFPPSVSSNGQLICAQVFGVFALVAQLLACLAAWFAVLGPKHAAASFAKYGGSSRIVLIVLSGIVWICIAIVLGMFNPPFSHSGGLGITVMVFMLLVFIVLIVLMCQAKKGRGGGGNQVAPTQVYSAPQQNNNNDKHTRSHSPHVEDV